MRGAGVRRAMADVVAALIAGLLLVACGQGGAENGSTPAASQTSTSTTTSIVATSISVADTTTTGPESTTTEPLDLEVPEPELRAELIAMFEADQEERMLWETLPPGEPLPPGGDRQRTSRLREIIAEHGWPTISMVGLRGATAAWVIAQHSDLDPDFQEEALVLMGDAAAAGEADPIELAYLTDRVASSRGEPQTYGTQIGCVDGSIGPVPPLAEPERVDELRAEVGLGTLDEYYAEFPPGGCS